MPRRSKRIKSQQAAIQQLEQKEPQSEDVKAVNKKTKPKKKAARKKTKGKSTTKASKKKESESKAQTKPTSQSPITSNYDVEMESDKENKSLTMNYAEIEQKDESMSTSISISNQSSLEPHMHNDVKNLSILPDSKPAPEIVVATDDSATTAAELVVDVESTILVTDKNDDSANAASTTITAAADTAIPTATAEIAGDVNVDADADADVDVAMEDKPVTTLAAGRSRRNRTLVSYRDDSSSEDDDDDEDSAEADNPLFAGLSKAERKVLKNQMATLQTGYNEQQKREREVKIAEIKNSFYFNLDEEVTLAEAGFCYDFCMKHQMNVVDKIEEEGDFFLMSMREMIEEKKKQQQNNNGKKNAKKKKRRNGDSDSEFSVGGLSDDSDSDFSYSSWDNPEHDNENMVTDDDDEDWVVGGKKRGKRIRKKFKADGKAYTSRCGRLLLNDALKDTENFEGWSVARVEAYKNKESNPNAYYYRFNNPGEPQKNGALQRSEHKGFMERIMKCGVNVKWGTFSMVIEGRVGYQCSNYWRQMMKDGWVKDPNYWVMKDGSFKFKRAKKGSIPDEIRKYSFVVVKDPSGVFSPLPGYHPKRPSDKKLKRYLEDTVKGLTENEKKGKKGKKKKAVVKGKGKGKGKVEEGKEEKESGVEKEDKDGNGDNKGGDGEKEKVDEGKDGEKKKSKKKKKKKRKDKKKKKKKSDKEEKKKGRKRKLSDEENKANSSEGEPPNKKRKTESEGGGSEGVSDEGVLGGLVDIMTGEVIDKPTISPYGHVMGYDSWCRLLRTAAMKNICPFTKKKLTRRSLVKLNEKNIEQYKDKIVNFTNEDLKNLGN